MILGIVKAILVSFSLSASFVVADGEMLSFIDSYPSLLPVFMEYHNVKVSVTFTALLQVWSPRRRDHSKLTLVFLSPSVLRHTSRLHDFMKGNKSRYLEA